MLTASASANADSVERYLAEQMRLKNAPGVSVAVVKDGKVIKSAGYGLSNIETNTSATPDTVYEIGSVTKQFTAAAILVLAQDGKLTVNDSIRKYFRDAPESWNKITIRHLLTHTSGIQNHVEVSGYLDRFKTDLSFRTTPAGEEKLRIFFELPLEFEAGTTWAYDNTGCILLGHIIEKASGISYYEFLNERIFKPLGMANTRSTSPLQVVKGRAAGYGWANGKFENRPILLPGIAFSAGAMLSTVIDMAKWDAALRTDRILTAESKKVMWEATRANDGSPLPFDYGFGWFLDNYREHRLVQHSGATPGFTSVFYRFPDAGLSVIILTNISGTNIDHWAIDVAAKYLPSLDRNNVIRDPDPALTVQHRSMLTALADRKFADHNVTPQMDLFFKTATGTSLFSWYLDGSPIRSFELSSIEKRPVGQMRRYKVMAGKNLFEVSFLTTGNDSVAQILWW